MKKSISIVLLVAISMLALVGCSEKDVVMDFSTFQTLRNFGDVDDEVIEDLKKEAGVEEVVKKEDGSVSITMNKKDHKELIDTMALELNDIVEYTKTSSEFIFVTDIDLSEDYSKLDISINKEELEIFKAKNKDSGGEDILEALGFSLGSIVNTYQGYAGLGEKLEINYIDDKSEEVIETLMFPDFFEKMIEDKE